MVTPQISLQKTQTILKTILHNQFLVFLLTKKPLSIVDCSFFFKHFFLPSMMQMIRRILLHKHQEGHTQMRFLLTKTLICLQLSFLPLGIKSKGDCLPFTGTFNGNDHTIQNIKMNMNSDTTFSNAGLFCGLGNGGSKDKCGSSPRRTSREPSVTHAPSCS